MDFIFGVLGVQQISFGIAFLAVVSTSIKRSLSVAVCCQRSEVKSSSRSF